MSIGNLEMGIGRGGHTRDATMRAPLLLDPGVWLEAAARRRWRRRPGGVSGLDLGESVRPAKRE